MFMIVLFVLVTFVIDLSIADISITKVNHIPASEAPAYFNGATRPFLYDTRVTFRFNRANTISSMSFVIILPATIRQS